MEQADVVVVGAGVIGASVAYHLAARGCTNVVVLDRSDWPGSGSTGRATGGFRAQYATDVNVRLSLLSREKLLRFPDEIGADPGYVPAGYLFLAASDKQLALLRSAIEVQRAAGLDASREVSADEAASCNPKARLDGVAGGTFCPIDGFIRPMAILEGYAAAAARLGARFRFGEAVRGFETDGRGRITSVLASGGRVDAGAVVNAAGAWAGAVAELLGASVPVRPARRQVAVTVACDALPPDMPLTVYLEDGFHLRVRDGRVLLLWPVDTDREDPFDTSFEHSWLDGVVGRARSRFPCLANVDVDRDACWTGLYEMSPDCHAILGRAPGFENLFLANGSSGHGVMHSPALGQLLAEIVLDGRATSLDVRALRPTRFDEGALLPGPSLL